MASHHDPELKETIEFISRQIKYLETSMKYIRYLILPDTPTEILEEARKEAVKIERYVS